MTFTLTTKRLVLRDFKLEDEADYLAFTSDKKYQRFYSEEDCHADKAADLIKQFVAEASAESRQNYHLAITDKHTQQLIGVAGLRLEGDRQASLGCGLSRHAQASGLAKEAATCLTEFAFNQLNCHRLYAETLQENKAAVRLCLSLGMREEALFQENRFFKNKWWSTSVLAILKRDWQALYPKHEPNSSK